jgi:thiol:disulfide interchange protein
MKHSIRLLTFLLVLGAIGGITISATSAKRANPDAVKAPKPADSTKAETISWLDFESGFAKAAKENKILLVDVYTDWCGWCKVMDRETYTNTDVVKKINESFVTVKLNPEKARNYTFGDTSMGAADLHKWLGYGETFGYPTTYFMVNPGTSTERYALQGYVEAAQFSQILDTVLGKRK